MRVGRKGSRLGRRVNVKCVGVCLYMYIGGYMRMIGREYREDAWVLGIGYSSTPYFLLFTLSTLYTLLSNPGLMNLKEGVLNINIKK